MAQLNNRIRRVLDESRTLTLAAQLVLGLQFRSFFEAGFDKLPLVTQLVKAGGLCLTVAALGLLVAPSAYQRLVERGGDSEELHRYAERALRWALLPFALGFGGDLFMATEKIFGRKWGVAAGLAALVLSLFFWYLLELYMRRERAPEILEARMESQQRELAVGGAEGPGLLGGKISHALADARSLVPGALALFGFQLLVTLSEGFDRLSNVTKYVHLAGLGMLALAVVLLMTPAAYHRVVEQGEETEHFHRFASKMFVAALVPFALGVGAGVYVVVQNVTGSTLVSVVGALVTLALFWELWFGITLYRRTQREYQR